MALQDISLPVDVPWMLIATSNDMLANHDKRFPHAMWKSSVAVFAYDPPIEDLPDELTKDRELSFLKVVCSITSYVPTCEACPPPPNPRAEVVADRVAHRLWQQKCQAIEESEHRAYACSGALVQVAVYPARQSDESGDPQKRAYFASFEPKKREMIEAATESGETMTQSKSDLNVRKGTTATDSTEDLDVLTGVNVGGGFAGAQASVGVSGQWGTIKRSASENVSVRNTDSSRETREQSSHTTSLSHLYHLLNSYHLGTNRAIFFVQPRPHTLQLKEQFTFIDGPQEIEGIQEFFLVLSRPMGVPLDTYCVDALLYTAHLDDESTAKAINDPKTAETPWLEFSAAAAKLDDGGHSIWNVKADIEDIMHKASQVWGDTEDSQKDADHPPPAKFDGYVTPTMAIDAIPYLNSNYMLDAAGLLAEQLAEYYNPTTKSEWKIDRTRGLGGYDLWEDPNNKSGEPTIVDQLSKFPPEALVDVLSLNSADELDHYLPDYALRVRAQVWPSTEGITMYRGRIKAYFIRSDSTNQQRQINMFVTVRGTSTCSDSPFFNLSPDAATVIAPDVVAENHINPLNVSPWTRRDSEQTVPFASLPDPADKDKQVLITRPKGNTTPSGLDHGVVGASRAKMANVIGGQVKRALNSSLSCLAQETDGTLAKPDKYTFRESDFFFDRVARKLVDRDLQQIAMRGGNGAPEVLDHLLSHARLSQLQRHFPILEKLRDLHAALQARNARAETAKARMGKAVARRGASQEELAKAQIETAAGAAAESVNRARGLDRDPAMPVLTLADPQLSARSLAAFHKAGITTALDLIGVPARELARSLETSERTARNARLRVLGLYSETRRRNKADKPDLNHAADPTDE